MATTADDHKPAGGGRLSSGVAGRGEGDRGHGLREEGPTASQVVLFFDRFGPSFSLIAAATKCMSTMLCVTQYTLRRRCSSFGMRVANCVKGSSAVAIYAALFFDPRGRPGPRRRPRRR